MMIDGLYGGGVRFLEVAAITSSLVVAWGRIVPARLCILRESQLVGQVSSDHLVVSPHQFLYVFELTTW